MLRVFGLAAGLVLAVCGAVVAGFTIVVAAGGAAVVVGALLAAGALEVPGAAVEPPALVLPDEGVVDVVGVVGGSSVKGVGTGGNGLDSTLAIISGKPVSEPLRNL